MRKTLLVGSLLLASVRPASANIGWWDFLEELSGPGPWGSTPVQGRLWCADTKFSSWVVDDPTIKKMVVLTLSHGSTLRGDPFSMVSEEATFLYRLHPMVDIGGGAGFLTFYRTGFSLNEVVLIPASIVITPLGSISPKLRFLKVTFDELYLTRGFHGEGWNTGSEFRPRVGMVLDIPAIFSVMKKK